MCRISDIINMSRIQSFIFHTSFFLLNNDERLGGVCVKPMSWLKSDGLVSTATAMVQGADLYEIGAAMIVGVLDKTGGAKAIITFRKGERPRKGVKEKQSILAVKPTPVPIASGI